jgi:hypothetical protein
MWVHRAQIVILLIVAELAILVGLWSHVLYGDFIFMPPVLVPVVILANGCVEHMPDYQRR